MILAFNINSFVNPNAIPTEKLSMLTEKANIIIEIILKKVILPDLEYAIVIL